MHTSLCMLAYRNACMHTCSSSPISMLEWYCILNSALHECTQQVAGTVKEDSARDAGGNGGSRDGNGGTFAEWPSLQYSHIFLSHHITWG